MTEEASAAIVPAASSRARGLEIAEFLDDRMKSNPENEAKKTSAGRSAHEVGGVRGVGGWADRRGPLNMRIIFAP